MVSVVAVMLVPTTMPSVPAIVPVMVAIATTPAPVVAVTITIAAKPAPVIPVSTTTFEASDFAPLLLCLWAEEAETVDGVPELSPLVM